MSLSPWPSTDTKKHVIWLCDTSQPFSQQATCEGTLSWLGKKERTQAGSGFSKTCQKLSERRKNSIKAAGKVSDLHVRSLVLQNETTRLTVSSLPPKLRSATLWEKLALLRMKVKPIKRVFADARNSVDVVYQVEYGDIDGTSFLYTSFTHTRRSGGGLPPLSKMQCIETKHTECDRVTVKMRQDKLNKKLGNHWTGRKADESWIGSADLGSKATCDERDMMALATKRYRR